VEKTDTERVQAIFEAAFGEYGQYLQTSLGQHFSRFVTLLFRAIGSFWWSGKTSIRGGGDRAGDR
jgi:hypothetical protein